MEWLLVLSEVCCHIQTLTHLREHTQTADLQHPPFARSTAVVIYSTCFALTNADLVHRVSFLQRGPSLAPSLCCIWTAAQDENKQTWQCLAFSPLMIRFCLGRSRVGCHGAENVKTGVDAEGCGQLETDMKETNRNPLVCANDVSMSAREWEFCVSLKHNGMLWELFI